MNIRFLSLFCLLFLFNITRLHAQDYAQRLLSIEDTYNASLKFGPTTGITPMGRIKNIESTIMSEPYFINYQLNQQNFIGWQVGFFAHYKIPRAPLAFYGEFAFVKQGTDLAFKNYQTDFNYNIIFKYHYANLLAMLRVYPLMKRVASEGKFLQGLYAGIGPHIGLNINSENLTYKSGGSGKLPQFGDDLEQQRQLRNVLKGRNDFGATIELGYVIPRYRLDIGIRANASFTDLVETQPNSYNFKEEKNYGLFLQAVLKLDISALGNSIR